MQMNFHIGHIDIVWKWDKFHEWNCIIMTFMLTQLPLAKLAAGKCIALKGALYSKKKNTVRAKVDIFALLFGINVL